MLPQLAITRRIRSKPIQNPSESSSSRAKSSNWSRSGPASCHRFCGFVGLPITPYHTIFSIATVSNRSLARRHPVARSFLKDSSSMRQEMLRCQKASVLIPASQDEFKDRFLSAALAKRLPGKLLIGAKALERKSRNGESIVLPLAKIERVRVSQTGPFGFLTSVAVTPIQEGDAEVEDVSVLFSDTATAETVVARIKEARADCLKALVLAYQARTTVALTNASRKITEGPDWILGPALRDWVRKVLEEIEGDGDKTEPAVTLSEIVNALAEIEALAFFEPDNDTHLVVKQAADAVENIRKTAQDRLRRLVKGHMDIISPVMNFAYERLTKPNRYIRGSVHERVKRHAAGIPNFDIAMIDFKWIQTVSFFPDDDDISEYAKKVEALALWLGRDASHLRRRFNESWITKQAKERAKYFADVEGEKLTPEQVRAALIFDDINLAVAAAGSGKSSVIVAKIGYALLSGMFKDDEIIALAFNADAANSLSDRISEKLSKALERPVKIQARTFHSLGNELLKIGANSAVKIVPLDEPEGNRRFNAAVDKLMGDPIFREKLLQFVTLARYPLPDLDGGGGSLKQNEYRYHKACREIVRKKREGTFGRFDPQIPTIDRNCYVRSIEEASIANWLILRHVDFAYEKDAPPDVRDALVGRAAKGKKPPSYNPDFSYPIRNGRKEVDRIWHEHFGIGANGVAPAFMGGQTYADQVVRKRRAFATCDTAVRTKGERVHFFETTSGQVRSGQVFDVLAEQLKAHGVPVGAVDEALREKAFAEFRDSGELKRLFLGFIQGVRESGLSHEEIRARAQGNRQPFRTQLFLDIALPLAEEVEEEYSGKFIDYCDMLKRGARSLEANPTSKNFKLILVDEFQDTALLRLKLIKALSAIHPEESIVFMVGDDWQAINRFAGSDLGIFNAYVPKTARSAGAVEQADHHGGVDGRSVHMVRLTETFRSCQGIADVARQLMNNLVPTQIDKVVRARNPETRSTIRIIQHEDTPDDRARVIREELAAIAALPLKVDAKGEAQPHSVFVLTRYRKIELLADGLTKKVGNALKTCFEDWAKPHVGKIELTHHTMHGSKGLEADFVIIPGMEAGYKGFPGEFSGDPLLELVLPPLANPMDEEVRLLYVAMTRARRKAILLTAADRPSEYILRLEEMTQYADHFDWHRITSRHIRCPTCKRGAIQASKEAKERHYGSPATTRNLNNRGADQHTTSIRQAEEAGVLWQSGWYRVCGRSALKSRGKSPLMSATLGS